MFVRPKMGYVRAKIGLIGQFDQLQPGNYLQPCMDVNFLINITTLLTKIIVETQLSNAVWNRKQKNYGPFP